MQLRLFFAWISLCFPVHAAISKLWNAFKCMHYKDHILYMCCARFFRSFSSCCSMFYYFRSNAIHIFVTLSCENIWQFLSSHVTASFVVNANPLFPMYWQRFSERLHIKKSFNGKKCTWFILILWIFRLDPFCDAILSILNWKLFQCRLDYPTSGLSICPFICTAIISEAHSVDWWKLNEHYHVEDNLVN